MKKKLILLVVLIVIFIAFIGVRFFILDTQNASGRIKIVSSPAAGVFINNVPVGKTPYENKQAVGEVIVKLIPEGEDQNIVSWQGKVQVYKNSMTYVSRELGASEVTSAGEMFTITKMEKAPKNKNTGEISVETEPLGAIVYLDNDEKGVAPLVLQDVPKGDHEISVFMPGFFRRTQKINIEGGYRVNASFKLSLDQTHKPLEQVVSDAQKQASEEAKRIESSMKEMVIIQSTPVGFLRVRAEPSTGGEEIAQVKPTEKYELLEEQQGWFKIKLTDKEGWISAQYAIKESSLTPTP